MDRPFIEELQVQNFGCIQDAAFRLTPLHALIGPNDSGKSTVLRALRTISAPWVDSTSPMVKPDANELERLGRALQLSATRGNVTITAITNEVDTTYTQRSVFNGLLEFTRSRIIFESLMRQEPISNPYLISQVVMEKVGSISSNQRQTQFHAPQMLFSNNELQKAIFPTQMLRLDPDSLRTPCPLIQDGQPLRFQDEHGTGLPAVYDAIVTRNVQDFLELNTEIQKLFPDVKSIALLNPSQTTKAIGVKLKDGTLVPAELMSEGLLYYLAFAALRFMDPPAILMIEEPENGLHPARIAEVMRVLREISKTIQIIVATHSPLVVNELQPEEVTVVTRSPEKGTQGILLKDTPNFEERSKVYALGELWLSYADGDQEEALLQGGPRP